MKIVIKYIVEVIWNYPLTKAWQMQNILCALFILSLDVILL